MQLRIVKEVHNRVGRLDLPFDALGFDPYGISRKHLRIAFTALGTLYRHYFSVEAQGIAHIPTRGRAMLVGNHSGGVAIDGAMVIVSCLLEMEPLPRPRPGGAWSRSS